MTFLSRVCSPPTRQGACPEFKAAQQPITSTLSPCVSHQAVVVSWFYGSVRHGLVTFSWSLDSDLNMIPRGFWVEPITIIILHFFPWPLYFPLQPSTTTGSDSIICTFVGLGFIGWWWPIKNRVRNFFTLKLYLPHCCRMDEGGLRAEEATKESLNRRAGIIPRRAASTNRLSLIRRERFLWSHNREWAGNWF